MFMSLLTIVHEYIKCTSFQSYIAEIALYLINDLLVNCLTSIIWTHAYDSPNHCKQNDLPGWIVWKLLLHNRYNDDDISYELFYWLGMISIWFVRVVSD